MLDKFKNSARNFLRPFYSPITSALRRRLGRNYETHPEMELPLAFDYVQLDVERHLHDYLNVQPREISQIVIVGALDASEVVRMERIYPKARFRCFEPNPNYYQNLLTKFSEKPNVSISNFALGKVPGKATFYELPFPGNGSLLEPDVRKWASSNKVAEGNVRSFEVQVSTLDREAADFGSIDLLWMDVQGAEGDVLGGAAETLKRTKSIFVEVALVMSSYKGGVLFDEIRTKLESQNFRCLGLGICWWNGTGNAFFVRDFEKCVAQSFK
jgi:FkbM family methyltransferase